MYFADEIRDPKEVLDTIPNRAGGKPKEMAMAVNLIESMTGPWQPEEFRDTYTDRVNELIAAKREGNEVTVADEAPEATNVVDLMSALRASVEAAKKGRGGSAAGKRKSTAKKATAKKATAKKAPAKKATAKKAPAKKAPAKKTSAKKTSAKKAPAKKTAATKTSTRKKAA
jgi:DNA end-binding protein Ku